MSDPAPSDSKPLAAAKPVPAARSLSRGEWAATAAPLLWLAVFFAAPTLLIFAMAMRPPTPYGGVGEGWSAEAIGALADPNYPAIIWRTLWISAGATAGCLALGLPCAYAMARARPRWRALLLIAVVVPFWTNFLIRIFAWRQVLHPDGPVASALRWIGVLPDGALLLYNPWAVLFVSVYAYLPFAILPLYAAAEKFEFALLDAARDLGAGRWRAFFRIFVPGVRGGLATAFLVVFIPLLGSYVIPDLVGGADGQLIGNKIAQRNFNDRNIPEAAALSAALALAIALPALLASVFRWRRARHASEGAPA